MSRLKVALLYAGNEWTFDTLRFVLGTKKYRVIGASDLTSFAEAAKSALPDVAAVVWDSYCTGQREALEVIRGLPEWVPVLGWSQSRKDEDRRDYVVDALLNHSADNGQFLEQLRLLARRRTGPKPKPCDASVAVRKAVA